MDDNSLYKKKYIEAFVEKIYGNDKINYLFPEPMSSFKQYALDMFLDTNLTEEQIADNMILLVTKRKKLYDENNLLIKRKQDIRNIVFKVYTENPGLFTKSLEDMQKDYIELYLNNSTTIDDIENSIMQTVSELKERKNNDVKEEAQPIILEHKPESIFFEENNTNDEINNMLKDSSNNEIGVINEQKEVNKVKEKKKDQAGSISLFSIGLSLLVITALILIAMILNVLLK